MSRLNYDIPVAVKQIQALAEKHSISYEEGRVNVHFYTVFELKRMMYVIIFQNSLLPFFLKTKKTLLMLLEPKHKWQQHNEYDRSKNYYISVSYEDQIKVEHDFIKTAAYQVIK